MFMLAATRISEMNTEELLGIVQPFLYLLPITIVAVLVFAAMKIYQSLAVSRMLMYMSQQGNTEEKKRAYLQNYLTRTSNKDLIKHLRNCPVCGKKYSLKKTVTNVRGDIREEWNHDGCPHCNTKVSTLPESHNKKYFTISRTPTTSISESKYNEVFVKLEDYIEFYQPYIDCSQNSNYGNITINLHID